MTSNIRNLIIGAVVILLIAVGAVVALGGGDDDSDTQEVVATTLVPTDDGSAEDGSGGDGSGDTNGDGAGEEQASGDQEPQGDASNGGGNDTDDATTTTAAQAVAGPTVNLAGQRCSGGKLIASVTANASNGYRKGVQSVTMTRQNEFDAFIQAVNATWLGPETGAGNQWDGTVVYQNNFKKTLRVVATSDSGQTTTKDFAITVPC